MTDSSKSPKPSRSQSGGFLEHTAGLFALLFCGLFFLQGLIIIPYAGIQNDEALFGMGIYKPVFAEHFAEIFHQRIPTMMMSYIGALKAWIYAAIFEVWSPSVYSVRIPVLLITAVTVWLFYRVIRITLGARAALVGCALLAFDTAFLMTATFDWGPVAFQHLLLVSAILFLIRYHHRASALDLGAGFLLLGVGIWDKAVFIWPLVGLGVAALVVFPRELYAKFSWRNAAFAVVCFLIGAYPLVAYNLVEGMKTFRSNANFSTAQLDSKLYQIRLTLEGGVLLGYIPRDDPAPRPGQPQSTLESVSVAVSEATDGPRVGFLGVAFVLSLALLPWLWATPARKAMLFALAFMVVAWLQMAFTKDAGGGAHHVVLMWPLPHLLIAAAFSEGARALGRAAWIVLLVAVVVVCGSSLLVTNQHLAQLIVRGPTTIWTDAINPLAEYMKQVPAKRVYVMDWGIFDALRVLDEGQLPLSVGTDQANKEKMNADDLEIVRQMVTAPDTVFVGHTEGNEVFSGASGRFATAARAEGYVKHVVKVVGDGKGRPIFEVYRWVRAPAPPPPPQTESAKP